MFRKWLDDKLSELYPGHLFDVLVPPEPAMGDYSTNIALVAAKSLKKNPRELAADVCAALMREGGEMVHHCDPAGPGFVNIFLKDEYLRAQLGRMDVPQEGDGRKVIVEYSSPNIAKPMHVGHLRSTIIGDGLARIYKELGYDVVRWNYIGDWGTQFGKLIAEAKREARASNGGITPQTIVGGFQSSVMAYVNFHKAAEIHPELEDEARKEFEKLEKGDKENRSLWQENRQISLTELEKIYKKLGVEFDVTKGESDYESDLPRVISGLTDKGLTKESEGALIVALGDIAPGMVRKSDGATTYLARDLASLEDRISAHRPAKILYVVANQQALHLEQLFAAADRMKEAGLIPEALPELVHVKYGLVLGESGKKFSTREGNAVPLQEVMDEAVRRAGEKNPDAAEAVGIGALKYADLRQHPHTDIVFDWDAMLDLGGNSGPYLQYTYARLSGILQKSGISDYKLPATSYQLSHPAERMLLRHMLEFGFAVSQCAKLHALNGLALYTYQLAELANRFYEQVRINDDENGERKAARLELVSAVRAQIRKGLELLGIQALERI